MSPDKTKANRGSSDDGRLTFEEAEPLEESGSNKGVTEVQQQTTEDDALVVHVGGVWTRVDVEHGNLFGKKGRDQSPLH